MTRHIRRAIIPAAPLAASALCRLLAARDVARLSRAHGGAHHITRGGDDDRARRLACHDGRVRLFDDLALVVEGDKDLVYPCRGDQDGAVQICPRLGGLADALDPEPVVDDLVDLVGGIDMKGRCS